jgi:acyl transferase domain-containing protein/NADPH:quinone reductase-like Zn-dependent oxidoreductase
MSESSYSSSPDAIAVIGMAGRFPGAAGISQFWHNLCGGVESVRFFSRETLAARGVPAAMLDDPLYVKANAVLDGIEMFDADFFDFTPREAEVTDPQHRVFLECAWEALEDSGYDPDGFDGLIGVFAGAGLSTYLLNNILPRPDVVRSVGPLLLQLGNNKDYVPLRVSYKLHLRGPSINVNTACSSSLVAVHLACRSLLDHQCDIALAGGVGIQVPQYEGYVYLPDAISSPDGHCRAFDAQARGTVSGNGAGIVVLKRLDEALADGDSIRAVILGSAVNNDGAVKVGFVAPSVDGQARVIAEALAVAEADAETIRYVEAHGTGTPLGDSIEIAALTQVFRAHTKKTGYCAIGSAKTNIGHLDEAAGIAGLIKTVLVLQNAAIPPSLHCERPNPELGFERSPFFVQTRLSAWESDGMPRRAGVSSFGIGGTNAHVVLQERPRPIPGSASRPWQIVRLSAGTETALDTLTDRLCDHLRTNPGSTLADVAYTLHVGRKGLPHRRIVLCQDIEDAVRALESRKPRRVVTSRCEKSQPTVVFMFPGQGSQHINMGLGIIRTEATFRAELDRCAQLLRPHVGFDLKTILYPSEDRSDEAGARLGQTAVAQPALFAIEYALARLWMSWGIMPRALIGNSIGEYVAACLSGVFSLEDALALVALRARLMQQMPAGAMLAVELAADELQPFLNEGLSLAVVSAPSLCVISGAIPALEDLERDLSARGVACQRLRTSHAFHSASMDGVMRPFLRRVREVELRSPEIPYMSNLTGRWITPEQATDPEYWAQHLRQTVRFSSGIQQLLTNAFPIFIEVGPGRTLSTLVNRHSRQGASPLTLCTMSHPRDPEPDTFHLMEAVGRLWLSGVCAHPRGFYAHEIRRRVALPTYPFERERYWLDPLTTAEGTCQPPEATGTQESKAVEDWFYVPTWKRLVRRPDRARGTSDGSCWLVFLDQCNLGNLLVERLHGRGQRVVTVTAGAAFARPGDSAYSVNPRSPDDYSTLIEDLRATGRAPTTVLHLWNVTPAPAEPDHNHWEDAQYLGFYSLLFLAQALSRNEFTDAVSIEVVSSHMQHVTGGDASCPEKATLLGPVRVIPLEYPGIRCRSLDLSSSEYNRWGDGHCVDQLLTELDSSHRVPVIALRGDYAWEQRFEPLPLSVPTSMPARLREGGVYLIVGGLGSMGLAFARCLSREARARLVLLGRSGLPPAGERDRRRSDRAPHSVGTPSTLATARAGALEFDLTAESAFLQSLESAAQAAFVPENIDGDERLQRLLRSFCSILIGKYFAGCGIDFGSGGIKRADLENRLKVLPIFRKFLEFLLRSLAADGVVKTSVDDVVFLRDPGLAQLAAVRQEILENDPRFRGLLRLLEHCTGHYRRALSGEIPSISVLYPDGTSAFLDECGQHTPAYARDLVYLEMAALLLAAIGNRSAKSTLRILEIGGGTGNLTRHAIGALQGRDVEYHFTDLGPSFVLGAQREAAASGVRFMRFGVLDISKAPEPQGYAPHSFDIVLGYNVVHATPRVEDTIGHIRTLLAPGGLLVLVEATRVRPWDEMVWGLTEGWWHFTDGDLRTDSPLLGLATWERVLRDQGFSAAAAFPHEARKRLAGDAGLVVAQQSMEHSGRNAGPRGGDNAAVDDKTRSAITALKEIEQLGGETLVIRADVADPQQMRDALTQVKERFGELNGVIHAAGVLGQGLIHAKTPAEADQVLAPKVAGTLVLDLLLKEMSIEPDFLILCSSLASLAPVVGQVDYCAANAFLDAFAASRLGQAKTTVISVDWGFWQELGMIEQAKIPSALKQQIADEIEEKGRSGAGVEAFRCILAGCPAPQVAVSPENVEVVLPEWFAVGQGSQHSGGPPGGRAGSGPEAGTPVPLPSQDQPHARPVHHPWFEECAVPAANLAYYVSHLDPRRHWVLDEHRPLKKAVLPGTAFLELARAAVEPYGPGRPIELREVYFLTPLVVEDDETREVRTVLRRRVDGFDFVVASRVHADRDEWKEHARGEAAFLADGPTPHHDLQELGTRCSRHQVITGNGNEIDNSDAFGARVRQFTGRWRNFRTLGLGPRQGLATLALTPQFASEVDVYALHPALLDMATGFLSIVDGFEVGVPFSYRSVRIWGSLRPVVHSHVKLVDDHQSGARTYDVTVVDGEGNELVGISGYTLREIDDASRHLAAAPAGEENFCVEIDRRGSLGSLVLRSDRRREPGPDEAEIEVVAAGLNFIEVLYALGLLTEPPDGPVRFGLECAGRITAVGEGVSRLRPGDEVFAFAPRAFSRFTTTSASAIAVKPGHLTLTEAATLPAAFTTAYYSLVTRGRLRRGERVLIHAAAGGVGLAAVNIAMWRSAEIFATAGTPEKREFLRNLGIRHVWNSRSLDFAQQALEATDGQGVDVVLNSLGGDFIPAGLSVLARYGRFLELGKRDILANTQLGLATFAKHLSFIAIDVGTDLPEFPSVWRKVVHEVRRQAFRPLPYCVFPVSRLSEAFEYMAQGKHIGKVVVTVGVDDHVTAVRGGSSHRSRGCPFHDILGGSEATARHEHARPADRRRADQRGSDPGMRTSGLLPAHARPALKAAFRAPTGDTERTVVEIWQELLGVAGIGVDDDFFELRGDSLLAAQVTSRLYQALQVKLPLSSVFDHPTVAGLASRIEHLRRSARELETAPSALLGEGEVEHEL